MNVKLLSGIGIALSLLFIQSAAQPIDRYAVVTRNNVLVEQFDTLASLSVGNGNFCFTTDLTGLQTFYSEYQKGVPLGTQSNWGWHSFPNTEGYKLSDASKYWDVQGRQVPYLDQNVDAPDTKGAGNYFRINPHRLHLGIIGFNLTQKDGTPATIADIKNAHQQLDLWTGQIKSEFEFDGQPVKVEVYCHQNKDLVAVRVESPLFASGQLGIRFKFPYPDGQFASAACDFNSPDKHRSVVSRQASKRVVIDRTIDTTRYQVAIDWAGKATFEKTAEHQFELKAMGSRTLTFSCEFAPGQTDAIVPSFALTRENNVQAWKSFWMNGGIVDFSACTDPRAKELERRVVLSQYLTKIQSAGSMPPQETGLTYNSWFGKPHLEMVWWHMAHFGLWNRPQLMEKQLVFYDNIYNKALDLAQTQGYKGVRWPKMVGPDGLNSPSSVASYLIWQQPQIIWLAEQMYRANPTRETLEKYRKVVFGTADFMADFPVWNQQKQQYDLAPPLIPAQEHWNKKTTFNPPFELAFWHWGLTTAQQWKERLNESKDAKWEDVRLKLPKPDQANGVYLGIQGATDSYTNAELMRDHPIVLAIYGMMPAWDKVDPQIVRNTMHVVAEKWNWERTWGWDYPMAAMTAVRLMEPELALTFLLKDVQKNTYLKNGHNFQDKRLTIYLPGNGGLLYTVAMMCAGWEGCTAKNPGFPNDGTWNVKWENLQPAF